VRMRNVVETLTFDDVVLAPKYSEIESRTQVDISTVVMGVKLSIPIISSPMDTVFSVALAKKLENLGGLSIIHRFMTPNDVLDIMPQLKYPIPSIGIQDGDKDLAGIYRNFTDRICIDVANGFHCRVAQMASYLKAIGFKHIMAGNVATHDGSHYLARNCVNNIRVGIGAGHGCITRRVSGHGMPQLSAIAECSKKENNQQFATISDGGIRNSGDIVKALAAGSDAVMIGRLFASTFEAPDIKDASGGNVYRGMASADAQMNWRGKIGNTIAEGVTMSIEKNRSIEDLVNDLAAGIRSGFSYSGARNLKEFHRNAEFIRVSQASVAEGEPYA
jgi:IMP dehydrogenase